MGDEAGAFFHLRPRSLPGSRRVTGGRGPLPSTSAARQSWHPAHRQGRAGQQGGANRLRGRFHAAVPGNRREKLCVFMPSLSPSAARRVPASRWERPWGPTRYPAATRQECTFQAVSLGRPHSLPVGDSTPPSDRLQRGGGGGWGPVALSSQPSLTSYWVRAERSPRDLGSPLARRSDR